MRITDQLGMHLPGAVQRTAPAMSMAAMQPPDELPPLDLGPAPGASSTVSAVAAPTAPASPAPSGRAWSVSSQGNRPLPTRPDGGIPVEGETGTVAYTGEAARQFLGSPRLFPNETEIVFPEGSSGVVKVGGEACHFLEPAVVLVPAGTTAEILLADGPTPLVVTSERPPSWYRKHQPEEPFYQDLARLNEHLVDGKTTLRSAFRPKLLDRLVEGGVLEANPDGRRVTWPELKTPEALHSRLEPLGLSPAEHQETERVWSDTLSRRLYGLSAGRFPKSRFAPDEAQRLKDAGVLREFTTLPDELHWARYLPESELRQRLNGAGFQGADAEGVVDLWRATSHAGYDVTGLNWNKDGVILYTQRGRLNLWSEQPTEWLVASTSFAGRSEPFTVGVSTVRAEARPEGPRPFRDIRPAETLHRHPVSEGASQTEAYLVSKGRGALLTLQEGKPVLQLLHAGDLAVLEPGVMHAVVAVDGDYEQLVFQVPSTFQYGFRFKESHDYSDFGLDSESILEVARQELAKGSRGAVQVGSPRPAAAPDVLVEGL